MVAIYCKGNEKNQHLCDSCAELIYYAHTRLEHCPWGEQKPSCRRCTKHCYKPKMKAKVQQVMRFSGPRMLLYAPSFAFYHLWREVK